MNSDEIKKISSKHFAVSKIKQICGEIEEINVSDHVVEVTKEALRLQAKEIFKELEEKVNKWCINIDSYEDEQFEKIKKKWCGE